MYPSKSFTVAAATFALIAPAAALYDASSPANLALYWVWLTTRFKILLLIMTIGLRTISNQSFILLRAIYSRHHSISFYECFPSTR